MNLEIMWQQEWRELLFSDFSLVVMKVSRCKDVVKKYTISRYYIYIYIYIHTYNKWWWWRCSCIWRRKKKKEKDKATKSDFNALKVKLPKLVIARVNGTHISRFRFWNQFESEIDRSELSAISKFPDLKELISPRLGLSWMGCPLQVIGTPEQKTSW